MGKKRFPYAQIREQLCFEIYIQEVSWHTEGKWLIHDTKHLNDTDMKGLELLWRICDLRILIAQKGFRLYHVNPIF